MLFIFKIENMNESFKNNIKSNVDIILSIDWTCSVSCCYIKKKEKKNQGELFHC